MIVAALAGCGDFEDPAIVLDLRPLAMQADPPEYVIPFDPDNPPDPTEVMLEPFEVRALIADPGADRRIAWQMSLCAQTIDGGEGRCIEGFPIFVIGDGVIDDPDVTPAPAPVPRVMYQPGAAVYLLLQDAIERDPLGGFSGIDLQIELKLAPEGEPVESSPHVAAKQIRFAAQVPAERVANVNPTFDRIEYDRGDPALVMPLPVGRCIDQVTPIEVAPGETLHFTPIEPAGVRETYLVPTLDGGSRMFTEFLTYQWLAGSGSWSGDFSGGKKDPFGNDPPLDTDWTATAAEDYPDGPVDERVPLWIITRDERFGADWRESCVRVVRP